MGPRALNVDSVSPDLDQADPRDNFITFPHEPGTGGQLQKSDRRPPLDDRGADELRTKVDLRTWPP